MARTTQAERGGLGRRSAGSFSRDVSPPLHARQIGRCPSATFKLADGQSVLVDKPNEFDHITSDTSQGAWSEPAEPCLVVR
jgi:hypothetical protein